LKPYYLTVAKRVKDQYPDVLIERVEVSGGDGGDSVDGSNDYKGSDKSKKNTNNNNAAIGPSATFEVVVDGKIVVRTQRTQTGSVFVSMNELDIAILRARKRRRPTTVYGENGKIIGSDNVDNDEKSRLEVLKNKATELQRNQNSSSSSSRQSSNSNNSSNKE